MKSSLVLLLVLVLLSMAQADLESDLKQVVIDATVKEAEKIAAAAGPEATKCLSGCIGLIKEGKMDEAESCINECPAKIPYFRPVQLMQV